VGLHPEVEAVQSLAVELCQETSVEGSNWSCSAVQVGVAVVLKRSDLQVDYYDCSQLLDMIVHPDVAAVLDHNLPAK
jgi:hypothetical protein